MYTKTITYTRTSSCGKVHQCTRTVNYLDRSERRAEYNARRIALLKAEIARLEELRELEDEMYFRGKELDLTKGAYEEYVHNVRDFCY